MHFFLQAEDGIRDNKVTGVQTCALPISGREVHRRMLERKKGTTVQASTVPPVVRKATEPGLKPLVRIPDKRSEERRVGKECRGRGSAKRSQKNMRSRKKGNATIG